MDTVHAVIYARQSAARTDGSEVSPEAQIAAGRALCESRGWVVAGVFADVGRSGWDPRVTRPEFEKMMDQVRADGVGAVVVNELSRLTRKGAHDALEIDKEFQKHGTRFVSVLEPFLDTSNPIGVAIFALIAALAKQDSDTKADRLKGAKARISAVGGHHSGVSPFGMRTARERIDNIVVSVLEPDEDNPDDVALVERMIQMSSDGMSDNAIANTFHDEGIAPPGARGAMATEKRMAAIRKRRVSDKDAPLRWRSETVRSILTHPAIGGFAAERTKRGNYTVNVIARNDAGEPLTPHRGITSAANWLALQETRKSRAKPRRKPSGDAVPTLLGGWRFSFCALCSGAVSQTPHNGGPGYGCTAPRGHGGLRIKGAEADDFVARSVWARLANADMEDEGDREWLAAAALHFAGQSDATGLEDQRREVQAHLDHVRSSIAELQADRRAGLYRGSSELDMWRATVTQYRTFEDQCISKLAALEEQTVQSISIPSEWTAPDGDPLGEDSTWASWDVFERRTFLDHFLTGVSFGPGRDKETKRIIPTAERVELHWRKVEE